MLRKNENAIDVEARPQEAHIVSSRTIVARYKQMSVDEWILYFAEKCKAYFSCSFAGLLQIGSGLFAEGSERQGVQRRRS